MRLSSTVCLVPSLQRGPWIYWHDLPAAARHASELGLDGLELFTEGPGTTPCEELRAVLDDHGLACAAFGTGAGKLLHGLSLSDPDAGRRRAALDFVRRSIDEAAALGCSAIVGSMQGSTGGERERAEDRLAEALQRLGAQAEAAGHCLLYEPLNRYESDLFNRQEDAAEFLRSRELSGVRLLCDLFHMNIEEADPPGALRRVGDRIGHVHLADSQRGPAGSGHSDFDALGAALREVGYRGWLSAEAFPDPDPQRAAAMTLEVGRRMRG